MQFLKQALNNPDFHKEFLEWLQSEVNKAHSRLESMNDMNEVYRQQGQITAYKRLMRLREDLNGIKR